MSTLRRTAVVLLLALYGWMAASVSDHFSATADEIDYTAAGYSYWTRNDYRLQPENGNFAQRWIALPLLVAPPKVPPPSDSAWAASDPGRLGFDTLYNLGNDPAAILARERTMNALLGVALAALVYAWSRSLFGTAGGMVSLVLAVFSPALLAHGGLATSDMAAALTFTLALAAWWRLCHRVTAVRVLAAGGTLGLLALAKFSALIFAPVALILVGLRLLRPAPLPCALGPWRSRRRGPGRAAALAAGGLAAAAVAVALIWAAYGFRFAAMAPPAETGGQLLDRWDTALITRPVIVGLDRAEGLPTQEAAMLRPTALTALIAWTRDHRLLPEAWLLGLASVDHYARFWPSYFDGEFRSTGWPGFFPMVFLLKTTLPVLGLLAAALSLAAFGRRAGPRRRAAYRLAPLLVLLLAYWLIAIASSLNVGHRHLLPTYPLLYILLGGLGAAAARSRSRLGAAAVGLALAWHAAESWRARPDYLAYFNEFAGGPDHAHLWFVDSSLDWGQDLPGLKAWLDTHARGEKVVLSYFGSGDPVTAGIHATRFADFYTEHRPRVLQQDLTGGVYCISATMLHRVYTFVRGPWSAGYEQADQRDEAWLVRLRARPAGTLPVELDGRPMPPDAVTTHLQYLEELRFGRLCHFLETRAPDANIGGSIFIYRLSDAEVDAALHGPVSVSADAPP